MRAEAEQWWRQAQADLAMARIALQADHADAASWFCQQAVEKGLKALLVEQQGGAVPPRTHDLYFLGSTLNAPTVVLADLRLLNPTFNAVRYPDPVTGLAPIDRVTAALAAQHLAIAERTLRWIEQQLQPGSSQV